jgi:hypothetical protein
LGAAVEDGFRTLFPELEKQKPVIEKIMTGF